MRKERGLHSTAAQSGRLADSCLKTSHTLETQRKTQPPLARPKPKAASSFFSFKILSFGNHRWLLHNNTGGLACSHLLSSFRLLPWSPCVGPVPPLPIWQQGSEVPSNAAASTFPRWAREPEPVHSFPWVYINFLYRPEQVLFLAQTSVCLTPVGSGPQLFPSFHQARLTGFFHIVPPPAAILTSVAHVPAFTNQEPEGVRKAFLPYNCLTNLALAYCSASSCHHLAQGQGIYC